MANVRLIALAGLIFSTGLSPLALATGSPSLENGLSESGPSERLLLREIHSRKTPSFAEQLARLQTRYGSRAVAPLLAIAANPRNSDPDRYVAIMGAAKLGGPPTAPLLARNLQDRSWMVRSATLRALVALKNPQTAQAVLPLIHDPALVVRLEAVKAIEALRPSKAAPALLAAIKNPENYHAGKAQWVPVRALDALTALHARETAPELRALLDHSSDPELQKKTVDTLDALTGKPVANRLPLAQRVRTWKIALAARSPR